MTVPKGIRIADSTGNEPKIQVDAEKMRRVFLALMQNAFDAMPEGGTLTIASQKSNGNLQISFVDSGVGMKKEIVKNLWNPLFTTKAKGMGLVCRLQNGSWKDMEAQSGSKVSLEKAQPSQ
jgi:signal transduction histidine kinase